MKKSFIIYAPSSCFNLYCSFFSWAQRNMKNDWNQTVVGHHWLP